ncbi:MAG TPA: urease accessory protein UreD [Hyphomicrobiaceae bacterium]|nr:urease accessory protein UreD [Hyphomicrobiaceae bacterium]
MLHARTWLPRTEGSVRLGFVRADGRTAVAGLRQSGAARVRFPKPAAGDSPEAVLLNTAGGVTGGDRLDIEVTLAARCSATVTTAAAEKVYRALDGEAQIRVHLEMEEGASLAWLPQPTILFDRARLDRRANVAIAGNATFLAVETLIFGRAAMGEEVCRGACRDSWRVRRDGRLVFADTFLVDGAVSDILDRGATLDGARAAAMLLWAAPGAPARLDEVRALLQDAACAAGASTWNGLLVVRAAALDGRELQTALGPVITGLTGKPVPRVWQC